MRLLAHLLLLAPACCAQDSLPLLERFVPAEQVVEDLAALEAWLIATHPLGLTSDTLALQGAIRRASNTLRYGASNWVFARVVGEAMSTWGDSHTGLNWREMLPEMEATWGRFPGQIQLEGGAITALHTPGLPPNTRIDSVGGWSARAVLENARGMTSSEGFGRQPHYRRAERLWPWLAAVPAPNQPNPTGLAVRSGNAVWMLDARPDKRADSKRDGGITSRLDAGAVVVTVTSFNRGKECVYRRQLRRAFRRIRWRRPAGVIIDLRGNAGGLASRMERLAAGFMAQPDPMQDAIEYRATSAARAAFAPDFERASPRQRQRWAKRDRWAAWRLAVDALPEGAIWDDALDPVLPIRRPFGGRVAVLVDGGTASTAAHFALWAEGQPNMVTVGEPALTGTSGTGAHAVPWTLPHAGLPVQCASMRVWVHRSAAWNAGQWMPQRLAPRGEAEAAARTWIFAP